MLRPILRAAAAACFSILTSTLADAQWQQNGNDIFYDQGRVGMGLTPGPGSQLQVAAGAYAGGDPTDEHAIYGWYYGSAGSAVFAVAEANEGQAYGVHARAHADSGVGVYGHATNSAGVNYGVYGETSSPIGYAGYFDGGKSAFFCDFVGIGRTTKITPAEAFGIRAATSGYGGMYMQVLASDGKPFYGYASAGGAECWHYFDHASSQWRLHAGGTRLAVDRASGRVGIGTTSPVFLLHVNGTAGKPGGGSWSSASDVRLKCNVEPLAGTLDKVLRLRGVSFEYRDPEAIHELHGTQVGMLAQEVEQVFPEWVEAGEDGFLRLSFRGFEALTVEALRELRAEKDREIEELAFENEALRLRLERLETLVKELDRSR